MIEKLIELLQKKQLKIKKNRDKKRKLKIKKLMLKLYAIGGVYKCKVEDLDYAQRQDIKKGIKYKWFVDYDNEFI